MTRQKIIYIKSHNEVAVYRPGKPLHHYKLTSQQADNLWRRLLTAWRNGTLDCAPCGYLVFAFTLAKGTENGLD